MLVLLIVKQQVAPLTSTDVKELLEIILLFLTILKMLNDESNNE